MLSAILGILFGIISTTIVAHYYYKRSRRKTLSAHIIMNNNIFGGVHSDDRKNLRFEYRGEQIDNLYQMEILIGNDGEQAISNCLKPLTLDIPKNIKVIDVSIIHKYPPELDINIHRDDSESSNSKITFNFLLLNKGDYFVVKLLLNEYIKLEDCIFRIMSDDLPRKIYSSWFSIETMGRGQFIGESVGILVVGVILLVNGISTLFTLFLFHRFQPELFPIPWETFKPSSFSMIILPLLTITMIMFYAVGIIMVITVVFNIILGRKIPFLLPKDITSRIFRMDNFRQMRRMKRSVIIPPGEE
jgi:hypothetical protein